MLSTGVEGTRRVNAGAAELQPLTRSHSVYLNRVHARTDALIYVVVLVAVGEYADFSARVQHRPELHGIHQYHIRIVNVRAL